MNTVIVDLNWTFGVSTADRKTVYYGPGLTAVPADIAARMGWTPCEEQAPTPAESTASIRPNPAEMTVAGIKQYLAEHEPASEDLRFMLLAERTGKDRKTVIEMLEKAL